MPEITQDFSDDGFHEIHLSGKQLVFLFMATTVVAVVVFLCGVLVGRGVRSEQAADPLANSTMASSEPPLTAPPLADSGPQAEEPPDPPAEADDLSFTRRLGGRDAPAESLREVPPAAREPLRRREPVQEPVREPGRETVREAARPPAGEAAANPRGAPSRGTAPAPPASQSVAAEAAAPAQSGTWVVQVHALRDRTAATGIVQRLAKKGYPAFLVAGGPPAGIYRVHVGRFKERTEAERIVERLKKEERFDPWITR